MPSSFATLLSLFALTRAFLGASTASAAHLGGGHSSQKRMKDEDGSTEGLYAMASVPVDFFEQWKSEGANTQRRDSFHMGETGTFVDAPVIVGVAGGSGSGKTTLAQLIMEQLGAEHVSYISHDNYYRDLSHLPLNERAAVNFDHPDSLETDLLVEHLRALKRLRRSVKKPIYDFTKHSRIDSSFDIVEPRPIIIVDGILIFSEPQLLELFDMKIFVDTDDDIRFIRRLSRDTHERDRTTDSVITQYEKTVRPMHLTYVEPSKRNADIIVPAGKGIQTVALDMCVSRLREIINFHQ